MTQNPILPPPLPPLYFLYAVLLQTPTLMGLCTHHPKHPSAFNAATVVQSFREFRHFHLYLLDDELMVDQNGHPSDQDEQKLRPQDVRARIISGPELEEDEVDAHVRSDEEQDLEAQEGREASRKQICESCGEDQG